MGFLCQELHHKVHGTTSLPLLPTSRWKRFQEANHGGRGSELLAALACVPGSWGGLFSCVLLPNPVAFAAGAPVVLLQDVSPDLRDPRGGGLGNHLQGLQWWARRQGEKRKLTSVL